MHSIRLTEIEALITKPIYKLEKCLKEDNKDDFTPHPRLIRVNQTVLKMRKGEFKSLDMVLNDQQYYWDKAEKEAKDLERHYDEMSSAMHLVENFYYCQPELPKMIKKMNEDIIYPISDFDLALGLKFQTLELNNQDEICIYNYSISKDLKTFNRLKDQLRSWFYYFYLCEKYPNKVKRVFEVNLYHKCTCEISFDFDIDDINKVKEYFVRLASSYINLKEVVKSLKEKRELEDIFKEIGFNLHEVKKEKLPVLVRRL